jgi:hypothetical protein
MNDANGKPMPPDDSWITASFIENRRGFPAEELAKYAGKHVGWGWDGTRIIASADSNSELSELVKKLGLDSARVVLSYIDPPDAVYS